MYLHVPLGVACYLTSLKTIDYNEFKVYLAFSFYMSGNCTLTLRTKEIISGYLKISQKTLNKHIISLTQKGFFGFNSKTDSLFIIGLDKLRTLLHNNNLHNEDLQKTFKSYKSFVLQLKEIHTLKSVVFSAKEQHLLLTQRKDKTQRKVEHILKLTHNAKKISELTKSQAKLYTTMLLKSTDIEDRESLKDIPNKIRKNVTVDDFTYLGVSNSFISNQFNRSKSWGSKQKKIAKEIGFLDSTKKYKLLQTIKIEEFNKKYISFQYESTYHKLKFYTTKTHVFVLETLYDEIESFRAITKRKKMK